MKVNWIPFLMTNLTHQFGSAGKLNSMDSTTIIEHFRIVLGMYTSCGFKATIILTDNQFESMQGLIADM